MSRIAKNSIKFDKDILCSFQNGNFNAKGKLGESQIAFFENNLYRPYRQGVDRINRLKRGSLQKSLR